MAVTTNYGWSTPDDSGFVKDGAAAIRTLGTAIDTSLAAVGAWATYTPTWTTTGTAPAIGNGTLTGSWATAGKTVTFRLLLTAGSTTTFGTGAWRFTLPTAPVGNYWTLSGYASDTSASDAYRILPNIASSVIACYYQPSATLPLAGWTNLLPITWASTDFFHISGTYQAA
ncbi:MAG: hypothetical protein WCO90_04055 [Planctomycetota bacterium]